MPFLKNYGNDVIFVRVASFAIFGNPEVILGNPLSFNIVFVVKFTILLTLMLAIKISKIKMVKEIEFVVTTLH